MNRSQDPQEIYAAITAEVAAAFAMLTWAEDEIAQATLRHPDCGDVLYHAFSLLRPRDIGAGMSTEFVYRSHAAEILQRVTRGGDTRPATAAEMCVTLSQISQHAPMRNAAAGLYHRLWLTAFPTDPSRPNMAEELMHYEHLHGPEMDDLEAYLQAKVADPERRVTSIDCAGRHHGRPATCRYATSQPADARSASLGDVSEPATQDSPASHRAGPDPAATTP